MRTNKLYILFFLTIFTPALAQVESLQLENFLPGIVSTETFDFNACFSPDGKEFYFSRVVNKKDNIYFTSHINGQWSAPQLAPFSDTTGRDADPMSSPDGKKLFFISTRRTGLKHQNFDLYYVEKNLQGWSDAVNLGNIVNSDSSEYYVSFAANGNLYFASNRTGGLGSFDLYMAPFENGQYQTPINLGKGVNSSFLDHDPLIAPDETYLIFTSVDRPQGLGKGDLYISFRKKDGSWTRARNFGGSLNSPTYDFCPAFSPDGKHFYYSTKGDVYRIPSQALEALITELRPR